MGYYLTLNMYERCRGSFQSIFSLGLCEAVDQGLFRGRGQQGSHHQPAQRALWNLSPSCPPNLCQNPPLAKPLRPGRWSVRVQTGGSPNATTLMCPQVPSDTQELSGTQDRMLLNNISGPMSSETSLADEKYGEKNHSLMNSTGFRLVLRMNDTNIKLLIVGPLGKMGTDWKLSELGFKGIHHTLVQC